MPSYIITDPETGTKLKLTGDTPPTEKDIDDAFKSYYESNPDPKVNEEVVDKQPSFKDLALASVGIQNIQKDAQGQNVINLSDNRFTSSFPNQVLMNAGSGIARGVGSLPFDLYAKTGLPGAEGSAGIADTIRKTIPTVEGGLPGADTVGAIGQYAVPGMTAFKAAQFANAPKAVNYASGLLGSAASDVAVSVPGETTSLGNLLGGPTAVQPTDDALTQRLKVGSEVLAAGPAVDAVLSPFRFLGSKLPTKKNIEREIPELLQTPGNVFLDPKKATAELENVVNRSEIPGYNPTTGVASGDTMGIATDRAISSRPEMVERMIRNVGAIGDETKNISSSTGNITDTASAVTEASSANLRTADSNVFKAEQNYEVAKSELDSQIAKYNNSTRSSQESASRTLDDQLQNELLVLNKQKKDLYDAIDPNGTLEVDLSLLKKAADFIRKPKAPLKTAEADAVQTYGGGIFKAIDNAIEAQAKGNKSSYKELIDLRANVNDAINQAYKNDSAVAAKSLEKIRGIIDKYTENLASFNQGQKIVPEGFTTIPSDAAEAAVKANDFYKNIYAPKFKDGLGGKWADDTVSNKSLQTQTAQKFLLGPTEGAEQLRSIINNAQNPEVMESQVREFMIGELAQRAFKGKGEVAPKQIYEFMKRYDSILDQFPSLKSEIVNLRTTLKGSADKTTGLAKAVVKAKNNLKQTQSDADKSVFKYFTELQPEDAVSKILSSQNPTVELAKLKNIISKNPEAQLGLKAGLRDEIYNRVINTKGVTSTGEEIQVASLAKLNKLLTQPKFQKVLSGIFNKSEMDSLNRVRQRVTELDRINIQTTTGSSTNALGKDSQRLKTVLASWYGIVKGQGIRAIMGYGGDIIRGGTKQEVGEKIITKAMLDPEFALLMLKSDTKQNQIAVRAYITNNYPEIFLDEEDSSN